MTFLVKTGLHLLVEQAMKALQQQRPGKRFVAVPDAVQQVARATVAQRLSYVLVWVTPESAIPAPFEIVPLTEHDSHSSEEGNARLYVSPENGYLLSLGQVGRTTYYALVEPIACQLYRCIDGDDRQITVQAVNAPEFPAAILCLWLLRTLSSLQA